MIDYIKTRRLLRVHEKLPDKSIDSNRYITPYDNLRTYTAILNNGA